MKETNKLTIHKLFWYFLIFSILGIIIETIFCYVTTGVLESRKGLIWGLFCPVYGISGVTVILFLYKMRDRSILKLFIYGLFVGSLAEYILSYVLESIYGSRFWDYTYANIQLNGRVCLEYSIYWGILSIVIIKLIEPSLDKLISKIPNNPRNIIESILVIFFMINCIFTVWGIQTYQNRVVYNKINNIDTNNFFVKIQQKIENEYFTNERMSRIFPNLRIKDTNGNEVWIKSLICEEQ